MVIRKFCEFFVGEEKGMKHFTYIILGAGPAGLQMAYFLEKAGYDYLVLEAAAQAGSFFTTYPRHRRLLSINKVHTGKDDPEFNLRHDWNSLLSEPGTQLFKDYSQQYFPDAAALVQYLAAYAQHFALHITYGVRATRIARAPYTELFSIATDTGNTYTCKRLLIATGLAKPYIPAIPGIDLVTGYEEMSLDPADYANQTVLILGKGNSAFETADHLMAAASIIHLLSPQPLRFAWQTRYVGHLRAVNNNVLDTYLLKSQNAIIDARVDYITRSPSGKFVVRFVPRHANETEQIEYDHVLRCTGFQFDTSLFAPSCTPALRINNRFPALTSAWEVVNVPHMYVIGTLMQSRDFHTTQSGFIHGFRYNIRSLFHMLAARYHGQQLPWVAVEATPDAITSHIIERLNRVSSLWQQVGFLCDLLVVPNTPGLPARYYVDLPQSYVIEPGLVEAAACSVYVVRFQFGQVPANPFDHDRPSSAEQGEMSSAIHPTIERYVDGAVVETCHLLEDLLADWSGSEYVACLRTFFRKTLLGEQPSAEKVAGTRHIVRDANMALVG